MNKTLDSPVNEGKHLWSHLLEEVRENTSVKLSPQRCLFVLGESESGKTTLISRLQGIEDINKSYGLEYHYIDVKDEDRDDQTKLGVYVLDGSPELLGLAKFALNENNFADTLVIIVVSMQEPWKIIESLNHLYDLLSSHCKRLKLDEIERVELEESLIRHYGEYIEPQHLSDGDQETCLIVGSRRHNNPLHPPAVPAQHLVSSPAGGSMINEHTTAATHLPISEGALKLNLGIPVMVVISKTDVMDSLKKECNFDDEHFDIIQMHIRRFCLERGAALFYTSVKEEKNCDLIKKYIHHRLYGFPFMESAYVVEKDCVFVPTGWDNANKINILQDSLIKYKDKSDNYRECMAMLGKSTQRRMMNNAASSLSSSIVREPEIMGQDEQKFLNEIREEIDKGRKNMVGGSGGQQDNYPTSAANRSPGNRSTAAGHVSAMKSRAYTSNTNTVQNTQTGEGVLANFFNSLLKKTNAPNVNAMNSSPINSTANLSNSEVSPTSSINQQPHNGSNPTSQPSETHKSVDVS